MFIHLCICFISVGATQRSFCIPFRTWCISDSLMQPGSVCFPCACDASQADECSCKLPLLCAHYVCELDNMCDFVLACAHVTFTVDTCTYSLGFPCAHQASRMFFVVFCYNAGWPFPCAHDVFKVDQPSCELLPIVHMMRLRCVNAFVCFIPQHAGRRSRCLAFKQEDHFP